MFRKAKNTENFTGRQVQRQIPRRDQNLVFSYHAARQVREGYTERQPEKIQRPHAGAPAGLRRAKLIGFGVLLLAIFGYVTWLNGSPKIVIVGSASQRAMLRNTAVYEQTAAKLLAGSPANHDKLTLDTNGIAAQMMRDYPELTSVTIATSLVSDQPSVVIEAAAPVLRLATTSGSTFAIAASGKAIAPASEAASASSPLVEDQSGLPVKVGDAVLPSSNVSFIEMVVQQLAARHIGVSTLILLPGTSELDVHLIGRPYYVKFNLQADVSQQTGAFLAVNSYLTNNHVTPAQYVDVRVLGRAYYK